ncbi:MAG: rubredoxin-like domain-containing protein [Anaerovoracaceae bacterium]
MQEEFMKWVCKVCGYVHEGEQPPEEPALRKLVRSV